MVICLDRGADLHMAQPMPLLLTDSCFSKIQIGLPFWYRLTRVVPEKGPLNECVCVCFIVETLHPSCIPYSIYSELGLIVERRRFQPLWSAFGAHWGCSRPNLAEIVGVIGVVCVGDYEMLLA